MRVAINQIRSRRYYWVRIISGMSRAFVWRGKPKNQYGPLYARFDWEQADFHKPHLVTDEWMVYDSPYVSHPLAYLGIGRS